MAAGFLVRAKNGSWGAGIDSLLAARQQNHPLGRRMTMMKGAASYASAQAPRRQIGKQPGHHLRREFLEQAARLRHVAAPQMDKGQAFADVAFLRTIFQN
jgi:hypothetical protein